MSRAADEAPQAAFHEDRRLLGRLLGEVIREQAGAGTLERIEGIRQTAVRFRRAETAHDDRFSEQIRSVCRGQYRLHTQWIRPCNLHAIA